jgi:hypothetical protein
MENYADIVDYLSLKKIDFFNDVFIIFLVLVLLFMLN